MPSNQKQISNGVKVLGIDPGIERLGWGLIEKTLGKIKRLDSGVKKTSKSQNTAIRLLEIEKFLDATIRKVRPDLIIIEKIFFSKNAKTALIIGEVRGVILMTAAKHNLEINEFSPSEVKLAVCGYGNAGKDAVATMLKASVILPNRKMLDDETDALALALCGAYSRKYR
jgi:crossover junction endodeoxyribonuclease RuvC